MCFYVNKDLGRTILIQNIYQPNIVEPNIQIDMEVRDPAVKALNILGISKASTTIQSFLFYMYQLPFFDLLSLDVLKVLNNANYYHGLRTVSWRWTHNDCGKCNYIWNVMGLM